MNKTQERVSLTDLPSGPGHKGEMKVLKSNGYKLLAYLTVAITVSDSDGAIKNTKIWCQDKPNRDSFKK